MNEIQYYEKKLSKKKKTEIIYVLALTLMLLDHDATHGERTAYGQGWRASREHLRELLHERL